MALHNCRNQRKICSYDSSLVTVTNAGKVCIVFVSEARRHTRMLRLGRQDSIRRRRTTLSDRFNEQFPRCSTKIDKSLEYYNEDRSRRAIIIAATQLAAAGTTMAAIGAKFAATKAFPNCKRIKLLRFLLNIETSHTICSLRRRKDCQQSVTKIDPRGTKVNKLVVQQRRREQQAGYYNSGFTLAAATMTATN